MLLCALPRLWGIAATAKTRPATQTLQVHACKPCAVAVLSVSVVIVTTGATQPEAVTHLDLLAVDCPLKTGAPNPGMPGICVLGSDVSVFRWQPSSQPNGNCFVRAWLAF